MNLLGYCRVSTRSQIAQGIPAQKEIIEEFCQRQGHTLSLFVDEGVSSIDERPQFNLMMVAVTKNSIDGVIVTKLDRFGRSVQDLVSRINYLNGIGKQFICVQDNIDTSNAQGRLLFHILAAFAEFEREIINERLRDGRARAEARGKICHRRITKLINPEQIKELHRLVSERASVSFIARHFGVSRDTVRQRIRLYQ